MNKKKLGALVGVVGVAGAITATQLIDLDSSSADYMSNDLINKLKENAKEAPQQTAEEVASEELVEKVYNHAEKVEYIVTASEPKTEPKQEVVESEETTEEEAPVEETVEPEAPVEESVEVKAPVKEVVKEESVKVQAPIKKEASVEVELPVEEAPVVEEPVEEAPVVEEPVVETPVVEEPAVEEPVEEAPVVEEPMVEEPVVEEPVVEETPVVEEPVVETARAFLGVVNTSNALYVRSQPTTESQDLGFLFEGDVVRGELLNGWIKISFNGKDAYVSANFVTEATEEEIQQMEAEREAARQAEEARKAEEERLAKEKAEQEAAAEAERKAEEERLAAEKKAEEERLAQEEADRIAATTPRTYWTTTYLNIRSDASTNSTILGSKTKGAEVVGTVSNGWLKLENGEGYLYLAYLTDSKPSYAVEEVEVEEVVEVVVEYRSGYTQKATNIRKGPGTGYTKIATLDTNYYIEGTLESGWVKFDYYGQTAYIRADLIGDKVEVVEVVEEPVEEDYGYSNSQTIDNIINRAYSLLGYNYVWGSKSPANGGFDCSGLMYYLYQTEAGITLGGSSRSQAYNGWAVSWYDLKPGDLLFFNTSGSGISHVGLYVGNGQMIHASDYIYGVCIDNIYSGNWSRNFVTARRILN